MKAATATISFLLFSLLVFSQNITKDTVQQNKEVRFEIRKENPAYGLTLLWNLPEEQLQGIVGKEYKPMVKDGK